MDMPKPGDAHRKLERLIGEWLGEETMYPAAWDPTGGPAIARVVNRAIVDGFAVVQEYEQRRGGQVSFRGHGVFWYDQPKDEYVLAWWDSMGGTVNEFRGQLNGDVLELSSPMPQGGYCRALFDLATPGQYAFAMEVSNDGASWQPSMEGRYKKGRVTAKKAAKKAVRKAAKKTARAAAPARSAKRMARKRPARKAAKAKRR